MFNSLLFHDIHHQPSKLTSTADFLTDLHLDQLLGAVRQVLDAAAIDSLLQPLTDSTEVAYRQEIFADLAQPKLRDALATFATQMHRLDEQREHLPHLFSAESRWINLVSLLGNTEKAIAQLTVVLENQSLTATGLQELNAYLQDYKNDEQTKQLRADITKAEAAVTNLTYRLTFHGRKVTVVAHPKDEKTLASQLTAVFQNVMDEPEDLHHPVKLKQPEAVGRLNNLQISVVNQLVTLYPAEFSVLQKFQQQYGDYQDGLLQRVAQELTFYLGWLQLEDRITKRFPVQFTRPAISDSADEFANAAFDFNLARTLLTDKQAQLITNDYRLDAQEQFIVISGPNQGGKTTYARMVGEFYYVAALGVPVPGKQATLRLRPKLATHFDRQESSQPLTGLLANDIDRVHKIIQAAVPGELVIMNELFSSTAAQDAEALAKQVLQRLADHGAEGIYVTFLSSLGAFPKTVSMMSQVTTNDQRTYKVIRHTIDDHAYATVLLARYQLTQEDLEKGGENNAR